MLGRASAGLVDTVWILREFTFKSRVMVWPSFAYRRRREATYWLHLSRSWDMHLFAGRFIIILQALMTSEAYRVSASPPSNHLRIIRYCVTSGPSPPGMS